jgi:hypothetical protein
MTRTDYRLLAIVALIMTMLAIVNATFAVPVAPRAGGDDAVTLINQYRASRGLVALRSDSRLAGAADFHNRWMRDNDCFAHQCAGEPDPWARIRAAGYSYSKAGEVIGRGYQDAASVVSGWRNSAPHDAIITDTYVDIGCAMLEDERSRETWWTCALASGGSPLLPTLTPVPSPTPRQGADPTPTPGPRPALPAGWWMEVTGRFSTFGLPRPATCPSLAGVDCLLTLRVDYDLSDWSVTDYLYATYCARSDVTCRWRRK